MKKYALLRGAIVVLVCAGLFGTLAAISPREPALSGSPQASGSEQGDKKDKPKPRYVGLKMCRVCHKNKKTGDQYAQWKKTKHAKAFETLGSARSKEIAAKLGIENPQKDTRCLKCHTTMAETAEQGRRLTPSDGVQCESCHGPGQFYCKKDIFEQGREVAMKYGLVIADEKLCRKCHNKESPTFPGEFNFKEAWKKVLHPNPQNAKKDKAD